MEHGESISFDRGCSGGREPEERYTRWVTFARVLVVIPFTGTSGLASNAAFSARDSESRVPLVPT
jgi:hypothetical protein